MQINTGVAQDEKTGRWRWQAAVFKDVGDLKSVHFSPVTFETEAEAENELRAHFNATTDSTDKLIRSKNDIAKLVRSAFQMCHACTGEESANLYWHSTDKRGCNWDIDYAQSHLQTACFNEVSTVINHLREAYKIPDEG